MGNFRSFQFAPEDGDINRSATAQEIQSVPRMTQKECLEIMKSQEYKTSKLAQEIMKASLAKGLLDDTAAVEQEEVQRHDHIEAKQAHIKKLFKAPEYKTDPAYRYEVEQKLAALTANDDTIDADALSTPNQSIRLSVSKSPFKGADVTVRKFNRVELETSQTSADAPAKPTREYFSE